MSLLLLAPNRDMQPWKEAIHAIDPNIDVSVWPAAGKKESVHFVVAWNHPKHVLDGFPNLKAVSSLGAGVDHILQDESLPEGVPVCRVVCPSLVRQMTEYVLCALLNYQRNTAAYLRQQRNCSWEPHPNRSAGECPVGIMGLGALGLPAARQLAGLGYEVYGWSRSPKTIEGVSTYAGQEGLDDFLSQSRVLICMLPLTDETRDILDLDTFRRLLHPAHLVNAARGEHLVEEDLIYALDKGWVESATLDVFREEPLPDRHPFWNRKTITITPHVSSITPPDEAAAQIVENYKRSLSGMELQNRVDRKKGY